MAPLLLAGFDSAWTAHTAGALVGALATRNGTFAELGSPQPATFAQATSILEGWQREHAPARTLILIDQPTIVPNAQGQRPVERILCSPVSARCGAMQPAYAGRANMFGPHAPLWPFLARFGLAHMGASPLGGVVETYPVLALIAWSWLRPHPSRSRGRLPKYNPARRATFSHGDWQWVCERAAAAFARFGMNGCEAWLRAAATQARVRKADQDALDACLCLLIALEYVAGRPSLAIGNQATGWLLAPGSATLREELHTRCLALGLVPREWVVP